MLDLIWFDFIDEMDLETIRGNKLSIHPYYSNDISGRLNGDHKSQKTN